MCGRYALDGENEEQRRAMLKALAWIRQVQDDSARKYWSWDARPTTKRAVFFHSSTGIEMRDARWGWSRDFLKSRPVINARYETAHDKRMFKAALRERRCVVPATAYYEWRRDEKDRPLAKYAFREAGGDLLLMAGLWEDGSAEEGAECRFLVLTRRMELHAHVHDRTPVMLTPAAAECWMDPKATAAEVVEAAASRNDHDLVVRSVVGGPSKTVVEGPHLMAPTDEPWPW